MLRITFLGTAAAAPTISRNVSSVALERAGELMLFDCGEGTQRQMMRYGTGFDVRDIFFTHFHADHFLGVIGFVRTLWMAGREEPVRLYGPKPAARILGQALSLGLQAARFPVELHEVTDREPIERDGYTIVPFNVDHRMTAVGYALIEDERPGRFDLERARELGIPEGPLFGKLQRGEEVLLPDGRRIAASEVVGQRRAGRKVVISGDTKPCASTLQMARGADLLIHEATFGDDEEERSLETAHSTARGAAKLAREAGAKRLILTHLSSRYDQEVGLLAQQARGEFPGVEFARDGMRVELPLPK